MIKNIKYKINRYRKYFENILILINLYKILKEF